MADEKWEVVNTKTKKKAKDQVRKEKKLAEEKEQKKEKETEEKKKEEMKAQFFAQYVQTKATDISDNAYDLLYDMENKKKTKEEKRKKKEPKEFDGETVEFVHFEDDKKKKKQKQPSSKAKSSKSKEPKISVQEASAKIDSKALKEVITQNSQKYPNNYDVQLKSLAEYLENAYQNVEQKDFNDQVDQPLVYVPKEVVSTLKATLDKTPDEALVLFFYFLLSTLLSITTDKDPELNTKGVGLRILIQVIASNYPSVITKNIGHIRDDYTKNNLLSPNVLPTLLWVFGQTVVRHPSIALTAWIHFFFPILTEPNAKDEVKDVLLNFVEQAIQNKRGSFMDDVTSVMVFEKAFFYKHSDVKISPRFQKVLEQLTDPSFLFPSSNTSKRFFGVLLLRAAAEKEHIRNEALSLLVNSLERESNFFSVWLEFYPNYIPHSNNVMLYIFRNWDKLSKKIPASSLVKLAQEFVNINKQLKAGTYIDKKTKNPHKKATSTEAKELDVCTVTCETLQKRLQSQAHQEQTGGSSGNSSSVTILSLLVIVGAGAYYTAMNCCSMGWCRDIGVLHNILKC